MFENSFDILKKNGVTLEKGLSLEELLFIESFYKIKFPRSLESFLMINVPVSHGFYNWRNMNKDNVEYINKAINFPYEEIYNNANEVYWNDKWGEKPDEDAYSCIVRKKLKNAPKLVPIYSHRYIPIIPEINPPVLSIHGVDIIFYGIDLENYFDIEFGDKKQNSIQLENLPYIDFWSDIM